MGHSRRRVDSTQADIVLALRRIGASVQHLHTIGKGCPDLLVGYRGKNILIEVKSDGGRVTEDESNWIWHWRGGKVHIVTTTEEAIAAVTN
jgi:hypothetical protein